MESLLYDKLSSNKFGNLSRPKSSLIEFFLFTVLKGCSIEIVREIKEDERRENIIESWETFEFISRENETFEIRAISQEIHCLEFIVGKV